MSRNPSPRQRIGTLALAFSVLLAAAPDAYGLGECPYHAHHEDRVTSAVSASSSEHSGHLAGHQDGDRESGPPCAWFADCHLCAFSPTLHVTDSAVDFEDTAGLTVPAAHALPVLLGPRHGLFELHLPNAPPVRPS